MLFSHQILLPALILATEFVVLAQKVFIATDGLLDDGVSFRETSGDQDFKWLKYLKQSILPQSRNPGLIVPIPELPHASALRRWRAETVEGAVRKAAHIAVRVVVAVTEECAVRGSSPVGHLDLLA